MPGFVEGVALAGRCWAPGARSPALDAGGIGPGAGLDGGAGLAVRGSRGPESVLGVVVPVSAPPEAGGASGKRAEAGGGGGMLPGYGAPEPGDSWRRVSWAPEGVSGPEPGRGTVPESCAGVEVRPSDVASASSRAGVAAEPLPSVVRIGGRPAAAGPGNGSPPGTPDSRPALMSPSARGAVAPTSCRPAPALPNTGCPKPPDACGPESADRCGPGSPDSCRPRSPKPRGPTSPVPCAPDSPKTRRPKSPNPRSPAPPDTARPAPPDASRPAAADSRPCVSTGARPSGSPGFCQSKPPKVGRAGVAEPRRFRSPKACQSESSLIRPPGSTISRSTDCPGSSGPASPTVGGWAGLGGVVGRGGTAARRASVLMPPPFPHVRAVRSCAGPRRSRRCGRRPSGHTYPHGRSGIPARRRRGANSPACVRVTLRVVPGRTGTSPAGRGHLPGTSPYPAVILSGSLRP
jgi:hypothetical protein